MKTLQKLKNKKGFTLVELIVVLVILAILAAMLVPALTGYIDKAREETLISETRMVVMAAQTEAESLYAEGTKDSASYTGSTYTDFSTSGVGSDIAKLAEVTGTIQSVKIGTTGRVTEVKYSKNGRICTYTCSDVRAASGTYSVSASSSSSPST